MSTIQNASSSTVLAYNKNDFFWSSIDGINEESCKACDVSSDACDSYTKIMCDNYYLSEKLTKIQTKHSGAEVRYSDINNQYNNEISKTAKLSIGIAGMLYFYWKLR